MRNNAKNAKLQVGKFFFPLLPLSFFTFPSVTLSLSDSSLSKLRDLHCFYLLYSALRLLIFALILSCRYFSLLLLFCYFALALLLSGLFPHLLFVLFTLLNLIVYLYRFLALLLFHFFSFMSCPFSVLLCFLFCSLALIFFPCSFAYPNFLHLALLLF